MFAEIGGALALEQFDDAVRLSDKLVKGLPPKGRSLSSTAERFISLALEAYEVGPHTGGSSDNGVTDREPGEDAKEVKASGKIAKFVLKIKQLLMKAIGVIRKACKFVYDKVMGVVNNIRKRVRSWEGDAVKLDPNSVRRQFQKYALAHNLPTTNLATMVAMLAGELTPKDLNIYDPRVTMSMMVTGKVPVHLVNALGYIANVSKNIQSADHWRSDAENAVKQLSQAISEIQTGRENSVTLTGVKDVKEITLENFAQVRITVNTDAFTDADRKRFDAERRTFGADDLNRLSALVTDYANRAATETNKINIAEEKLRELGKIVDARLGKDAESAQELDAFNAFYNLVGISFNVFQAELNITKQTAYLSNLLVQFVQGLINNYREGK